MSPIRLAAVAGKPVKRRWYHWRPQRHQVIGVTIAVSAVALLLWQYSELSPAMRTVVVGVVGWFSIFAGAIGFIRRWMFTPSIPPGEPVTHVVHHKRGWW